MLGFNPSQELHADLERLRKKSEAESEFGKQ
jgi:hypothetical protein